jgi:hypothetical protein
MARVRKEADTFTIPEGRRRRVYRPRPKFWREAGPSVNPKTMLAHLDAAHGFASACPLYPRSRPDCGHCRGSESGQSLTFASAQRARPLPANAPLTFAGIMPSADVADTNDRVWFREGCGPEAEIQDLASVDTQFSPTQAIHTQKKSGSKPDEAISSRPPVAPLIPAYTEAPVTKRKGARAARRAGVRQAEEDRA